MSDQSAMRLIEEQRRRRADPDLDYPARRNAFAMPIRVGMIAALERAQADKSIRAIVVTGSGGHFCSGGDISGMDVKSPLDGRERMRLSHQLVRLMVMGSVPVVAAIEGFCVGAGAVAGLRHATPSSRRRMRGSAPASAGSG